MTEREIVSEEENPEKEHSLFVEAWFKAPKLARQAIKLSLGVFVITVVLSMTYVGFAGVLYAIPLTIILSYTIVAGIIGTVLSSLSMKEQKTFFGIISLIICVIATLLNAYIMFMVHCDTLYSIPPP